MIPLPLSCSRLFWYSFPDTENGLGWVLRCCSKRTIMQEERQVCRTVERVYSKSLNLKLALQRKLSISYPLNISTLGWQFLIFPKGGGWKIIIFIFIDTKNLISGLAFWLSLQNQNTIRLYFYFGQISVSVTP